VRSATKATAELIEAAPKLKIIGRAGAGVDNVDVAAATRRGVLVVNVPGGSTLAVAELTMAMLLSLVRHVPRAHASMSAGKWEKSAFMGSELNGKTLGLVGCGRIGRAVAARAQAFGMRVLASDPAKMKGPAAAGVEWAELDSLLERADVVSLHIPLNDKTRGLIGKAQFARMKPGALLVHCARGGVVDEAALLEALGSGRLAGAALDVFEKEPPAPDHPLLKLPNVVAHGRTWARPPLRRRTAWGHGGPSSWRTPCRAARSATRSTGGLEAHVLRGGAREGRACPVGSWSAPSGATKAKARS